MQQTKSDPKLAIPRSILNFVHLPDSSMMRPQPSAQLLGVSMATLWRLIKKGKLKTKKLTERTTTIRVGDLRSFMSGKVEG